MADHQIGIPRIVSSFHHLVFYQLVFYRLVLYHLIFYRLIFYYCLFFGHFLSSQVTRHLWLSSVHQTYHFITYIFTSKYILLVIEFDRSLELNTHVMSAFWGYCPTTHLFRLVPYYCLKVFMFNIYLSVYSSVFFVRFMAAILRTKYSTWTKRIKHQNSCSVLWKCRIKNFSISKVLLSQISVLLQTWYTCHSPYWVQYTLFSAQIQE